MYVKYSLCFYFFVSSWEPNHSENKKVVICYFPKLQSLFKMLIVCWLEKGHVPVHMCVYQIHH